VAGGMYGGTHHHHSSDVTEVEHHNV